MSQSNTAFLPRRLFLYIVYSILLCDSVYWQLQRCSFIYVFSHWGQSWFWNALHSDVLIFFCLPPMNENRKDKGKQSFLLYCNLLLVGTKEDEVPIIAHVLPVLTMCFLCLARQLVAEGCCLRWVVSSSVQVSLATTQATWTAPGKSPCQLDMVSIMGWKSIPKKIVSLSVHLSV